MGPRADEGAGHAVWVATSGPTAGWWIFCSTMAGGYPVESRARPRPGSLSAERAKRTRSTRARLADFLRTESDTSAPAAELGAAQEPAPHRGLSCTSASKPVWSNSDRRRKACHRGASRRVDERAGAGVPPVYRTPEALTALTKRRAAGRAHRLTEARTGEPPPVLRQPQIARTGPWCE